MTLCKDNWFCPREPSTPIQTITGLDAPCYIAISDDKCVVTEFYDHFVTILDKIMWEEDQVLWKLWISK